MPFGWEGNLVRLVPLDEGRHFDNAVLWLNDPEVTRFLLVGDMPLTKVMEREYFQIAQTETNIPFAIETLEGDHIGFCGIHNIQWRHGHASTGTLIGRRELWGKGFGSDAVAVRTQYALDVLGLRILTSDVMAENVASIKMLERSGYVNRGVIPARYFKRGKYHDAVMMVRNRDA